MYNKNVRDQKNKKTKRPRNHQKDSKDRVKREQPRKDSDDKRINLDNERESKFIRMEKDGTNDLAWYSKNPQLLQSSSNIFFSTVTGQSVFQAGDIRVPGVLNMFWQPSIGGGDINAINQASNQIYSNTVHANSRNTSYDANDEMILILAGGSVFSFMAFIIRLYGLMKHYDGTTRYVPKALVYGMGVDFEDLLSNLSNMWFDINAMIAETAQIWIPNNIPLITRWFWLNTNVYMDSESPKGQYYTFSPRTFWAYSEVDSETGGCLMPLTSPRLIPSTVEGGQSWGNPELVDFYVAARTNYSTTTVSNPPYKWAELKMMFRSLMQPLLNSKDRGLIFGDILKAYGADTIYALSEIPADYKVQPVYNPEVLTQIENATVATGYPYTGIIQNLVSNTLQNAACVPTEGTTPTIKPTSYRRVLNFHQLEQPNYGQIMIATRLMLAGGKFQSLPVWAFRSGGGDTGFTYKWHKVASPNDAVTLPMPMSTGSEVITGAMMYYLDGDETLNNSSSYTADVDGLNLMYADCNPTFTSQQYFSRSAIQMMNWVSFDWAPWLYDFLNATPSGPVNTTYSLDYQRAYGDWDNYAIINGDDLLKMHTAAIYSEFGVPTM